MEENQPFMHFSFFVSKSNGYCANSVQVKAGVILVEIGRDPAHPDVSGFLSGEDSH